MFATDMSLLAVSLYSTGGLATSARAAPSFAGAAADTGGLNLFKRGSPQAEASGGWRTGDCFLQLPNKVTPKLNWGQNYGALRSEMSTSRPIFDSYRTTRGQLIPAKVDRF